MAVLLVVVVTAGGVATSTVAEMLDCLATDGGACADGYGIRGVGAMDNEVAADRPFDIDGVIAAAKLRDQAAGDCRAAGDRDVVVSVGAVDDRFATTAAIDFDLVTPVAEPSHDTFFHLGIGSDCQ